MYICRRFKLQRIVEVAQRTPNELPAHHINCYDL